jgi:hypothetical protein
MSKNCEDCKNNESIEKYTKLIEKSEPKMSWYSRNEFIHVLDPDWTYKKDLQKLPESYLGYEEFMKAIKDQELRNEIAAFAAKMTNLIPRKRG